MPAQVRWLSEELGPIVENEMQARPYTQKCAFCGQEWWDAHSCKQMAAAITAPMPLVLPKLYTQAEVDALITAERDRICNALPGGHSVDPQWVADMVRNGA